MHPTRVSPVSVVRGLILRFSIVAIAFGVPVTIRSAPPLLYTDPLRESPVRAVPDELMLIAGSGLSATDAVVYLKLTNTTLPLVHPATVPASSTSTTGVAAIVASNDAPDAITVRLPAVMLADTSYAFWVKNSSGWSAGFKTNDARPMWVSPGIAYKSASVGTIGRQVKLVGRNLQPAPGTSTKVTFTSGNKSYTLTAANDLDPATAIEHYVAKVTLPNNMQVGIYNVKVMRDGVSSIQLAGETLDVRADPLTPSTFNVGSYGCSPNDGNDDTACVVAAIQAATPSGGRVSFAAGTWDLGSGNVLNPPPDVTHGIVVPLGVSLVGAGQLTTTVRRGTAWRGLLGQWPSVFTLQGRNVVSDATFEDVNTYDATLVFNPPYFALGKVPSLAGPSDPTMIDEVTFMRNTFARPMNAIGNGGFPIRHLVVTGNEFGAYGCGLYPGGVPSLTNIKFRIDDSIIVGNTFKPGGYFDPPDNGTIASQLGAGYHVDFSGNTADGHAIDYLADTAHPGWRAAFFWYMTNNQEYVLVSQNMGTCTGDKAGEGEMIDFDFYPNTHALAAASVPSAVTATTITLPGPLETTSPTDYYNQHWIQIVDGTGLGQTRKIVSYTNPTLANVTFTISPGWDVTPALTGPSASRATVARQYWQVYAVDNTVDIHGCQKENPHIPPHSGQIVAWGMMADSAFEHNQQYESDGLELSSAYSEDPSTKTVRPKYFVELRSNTVDHEYNYNDPCSWSGVVLGYGNAIGPSIVVGYGVNVVKNTVINADGLLGGGIGIIPGWNYPTTPMFRSTIIQRNLLQDIQGASPPPGCGDPGSRIGINVWGYVNGSGAWRTVLFANTFTNVTNPIADNGTQTVQVP